MSEFVAGTCAVSGQPSGRCVVTRWVAAKEQGFEGKETPGGWGTYGWGGKMKISDVMAFDVYLSEEAIQSKLEKRRQITGFLAAFVALGVIIWAVASMASTGSDTATPGVVIEVLSLASYILCRAAVLGLIVLAVMHMRGFRTRHTAMDELEPLEDMTHKRVAYNLSKRIAEKRASKDGRDTVWSASRFKEGIEENAWIIEGQDAP
jgi:hypothetical protein